MMGNNFFNRYYRRLDLSNIGRAFIYFLYHQYKDKISKKLPVYDLEVVSIIKRLPKDAVCIDIGVNEAQLFSSMIKHCTKGKVYGFEPVPILYQYLDAKFSGEKVHVFPNALSDTEAEVPFYYFPKRSGVSGLSNRIPLLGNIKVEKLQIRTVTLDSVLDLQRIDLIKIDVEGAELKVLKGAIEHIQSCKPIIVFEWQQQGSDYFETKSEEIFAFFQDLGYGVSLTKYYLMGLPPLPPQTLLNLTKHRYEYQFVAWPNAVTL